jgi:hypothetical protein
VSEQGSPATPRTEAGRRFVERHGTGKQAEVVEIEREAALTHGGVNVGTVYGYEAGIEEGRRQAREDAAAPGLRAYVQHKPDCRGHNGPDFSEPCSCGLTAILAANCRAREIAAGLAEIGTGGTPAFIRGYNAGWDDAWEARSKPTPEPFELWQQADGDRDRYLALMREHGHIVPGKREPGQDVFGHPATADTPEATR